VARREWPGDNRRASGRPANFEALNALVLSEPEVRERFIEGKIAPTGFELAYLVALGIWSIVNRKLGADAIAITNLIV